MTPEGRPPSGLKRFAALSLTYFAAIGLFNPYAPLWFQSLGMSTLAIGAVASLQSWTRVFAPYAWSWAGDHGGRRVELIRLAALGSVLAALGLLGVQGALAVALVTALLFMANAGVVPLYEATLAQLLSTPRAGPARPAPRGGSSCPAKPVQLESTPRAGPARPAPQGGSSRPAKPDQLESTGAGMDLARYGRVRMWGSVGFIASVTAFGALLDLAGIGIFPYFVAAMNLLLLLAALRLPRVREDVHADEPAPPVLPRLKDPVVAWFFASIFFTVLAHTSLYAFFSLYLVSLGYGKSAVGALWAVSVAVEIAFFWTQGRWSAWLAPERWLQVVAGATVLRFAAIAAGGAWPVVLVLAQLSHAVTFAAHHAACIALVHRHFPGRLRGRGQALYTILGYGFPGVLGGVGGGWLIEHQGFAAVFWAATLAGLVALGCSRRAGRLAGVRPLA